MAFKRDVYAKYTRLVKNYFALIGGKPEVPHFDDGSFQPLKEIWGVRLNKQPPFK